MLRLHSSDREYEVEDFDMRWLLLDSTSLLVFSLIGHVGFSFRLGQDTLYFLGFYLSFPPLSLRIEVTMAFHSKSATSYGLYGSYSKVYHAMAAPLFDNIVSSLVLLLS